MNATGRWGIAGATGSDSAILTIRSANVVAQGRSGSICDIQGFTLDNVAINSPTGAAYDSSLRGVALNGTVVTDAVVIMPLTASHGIEIAGTPVTPNNCNDLRVIDGVSGTVKYDPTTNTLTLDNATFDAGDVEFASIDNWRDPGLTIQVNGTNKITANGKSGIFLERSTTIR